MILDINSAALTDHVAQLEFIGRSALPVVARQTLNKAAYNVKTESMPDAAKVFTSRKGNFFKANSKVEAATGFDVNSMRATIGFVPKPADTSHAVEDLEQQERGGDIDNRSFIPLKEARTSSAWNRMVKSKNRLSRIKKEIFNAKSTNLHGAKNDKEAFTISAIYAGKGGYVLGTEVNSKGNRLLYYINSVKRLDTGKTVVNSTAIYAVKAKRKVKSPSYALYGESEHTICPQDGGLFQGVGQ